MRLLWTSALNCDLLGPTQNIPSVSEASCR